MAQFKLRDTTEGKETLEFWLVHDEWAGKVVLMVSDGNGNEHGLVSVYQKSGLLRRWHSEGEINGLQQDSCGRIMIEEGY